MIDLDIRSCCLVNFIASTWSSFRMGAEVKKMKGLVCSLLLFLVLAFSFRSVEAEHYLKGSKGMEDKKFKWCEPPPVSYPPPYDVPPYSPTPDYKSPDYSPSPDYKSPDYSPSPDYKSPDYSPSPDYKSPVSPPYKSPSY